MTRAGNQKEWSVFVNGLRRSVGRPYLLLLMSKHAAILLIGPTGSGKTPLGNYLESNGLAGRTCFHFDFGENLRRIAGFDAPQDRFSQQEIQFIRKVLNQGSLLENRQFYLAQKILESFVQDRKARPQDLIVLNGLPRHQDQARDMDNLVQVEILIHLACTPQVVLDRIKANTGGDRGGREDDTLQVIQKKLSIFEKRTTPLLNFYQQRGILLHTIKINAQTSPEQIMQRLMVPSK